MVLPQEQDDAVRGIQTVVIIVIDNEVAAVLLAENAADPDLGAQCSRLTEIEQRGQQLAGAAALFGRQAPILASTPCASLTP